MKRNYLKSILSIALTLLLTLSPSSLAYSATPTSNETVPSANTSSSIEAADDNLYANAELVAQKKAAVLISNSYGATSVQYALIANGEIVLSGQAGDYSKDKTTKLTNNHMYGIGSVSKVFTTAAVMQLVDQGKVELDTPVTTYIPKFTMADPRYKDITVRMLLNHSSGLMGSVYNNSFYFGNDVPSYDLLSFLKTSRLKADPGEFSVYCNDGFTLAQLLIEKVSKMSYSEFIMTNISDPLKLTNTKTSFDKFQKDNLVKTYLPGSKNALPTDGITILGAGGIYSTAENLCHFAEIFMDNNTSNVLSSSSAKAMENEEYKNGLWPKGTSSLLSYGLGWDNVKTDPFSEYGITALTKGGDTLVYHASMVVLPKKNMAMAVLTSGGSSACNQLMAQEVLLAALEANGSIEKIKTVKIFTQPVAAPLPSSMKKWEGYYAVNSGIVKVSFSDDGVLELQPISPSAYVQKFTYAADGKFYSSDGGTSLSFITESNGNTYLYGDQYGTYPGLGQLHSVDYLIQRLPANPISQEVKAVWEKRDNKNYFFLNEAYNSQMYVLNSPIVKLNFLSELEGYCMSAAIVDENTAKIDLKLPGLYGRDLSDIAFYTVKGTEYLKMGSFLLTSEDSLTSLSTKSKFTCTLGKDGYAKWYSISTQSANKKIKVTLPAKSSFSVYNKSRTCIFSSTTSSPSSVTLPSGGYIVFAGSAGAKFTVKYLP